MMIGADLPIKSLNTLRGRVYHCCGKCDFLLVNFTDYACFLVFTKRMEKFSMRSVRLNENIEAAIAAVIAFLVSLIPIEIGPSFGIQVSLAAIYIVALRRGVRVGVLSGFLLGLIKFISGFASILTPIQGIIEYIFAFALAGLAGLLAVKVKEAVDGQQEKQLFLYIGLATLMAIVTEYFVHFLAGVVFWGQFAPDGMSPWVYSGIMNAASGFATWIATFAVTYLLIKTNRKIIFPDR